MAARPPLPRFTRHATAPDLTIVGSNLAPRSVPMNVVTRASNGSISYQQLYADLSPDTGDAVSYYYPGTFGHVVAAGRGWRG